MPSTRDIKNRIKGIQDTQKITNAMYLISTTKLRRARKALEATRPYFDTLRRSIARMLAHMPEVESRYLMGAGEDAPSTPKRRAYLVVTADRGLAGAYNHNVLKLASEAIEGGRDWELYVVGEYGRKYFSGKHIAVEQSFLYTAQNPTLHRARSIAYTLLDRFDTGAVEELDLVYTDLRGSMGGEAQLFQLLPFDRAHFGVDQLQGDPFAGSYEFYPSLGGVLDQLLPNYMSGFIYSALVDSFCAEQNARMLAMDAANRNAEEMLRSLRIQYNRVRQAQITQEITEIAAGAMAQRRKRRKKEDRA